jgi:hypothetical protein
MKTDRTEPEYQTPRIEDHGNLTELTAAGSYTGYFDANYCYGKPIPPGGPGSTTP